MAPRAILITAIAVIAVTFTLVVVLLSAIIESILPAVVITSFSLTTVIGSILLTAAIASLVLLLSFYMFVLATVVTRFLLAVVTATSRLTSHSAQYDPGWAELGWPANYVFSSLSSWVGLGLIGVGLEAKLSWAEMEEACRTRLGWAREDTLPSNLDGAAPKSDPVKFSPVSLIHSSQ